MGKNIVFVLHQCNVQTKQGIKTFFLNPVYCPENGTRKRWILVIDIIYTFRAF